MRSHWLVSTAVAAALLTPAAALAQAEPAQNVVGLEEIVVTAQRVEENLQRAALAISAVSADQLERQGITNVTQLTQLTPALQIANLTGSYPALYLRGVGNFSTNSQSDPAIAFSVDGVYFARQNSLNGTFFDLQRVEVLKGPQGTLYGRNATGGAINVITNKPVIGEYSGRAMVELGNFDHVKTEGVINLPLMDKAALRVAAQSIRHDGYYSDGNGNEDSTSLRAQLAFEPSDAIHVNVGADYSKQKGVSGSTLVGAPFKDWIGITDPRIQAIYATKVGFLAGTTLQGLQNDLYTDNNFYGVYAQADIQTPIGTLTVLPAYRRGDIDNRYANQFTISQIEKDTQKSLEIRLASDNDRALRYLAGLYYFDEKTDGVTQYNQGFFVGYNNVSVINTTSYAAFGRLTWAVTDKFRVTGGVRYTKDEKDAQIAGANGNIICPGTAAVIAGAATVPVFCFGTPNFPNGAYPDPRFLNPNGTFRAVTPWGPSGAIVSLTSYGIRPSKDFSKTTWRAAAEYDLAPDSLLYASVETGFKAGGFFATLDNPVYAPETIVAYTIGSKNRLFDNRLQLNAELFYWKYTDQQYSHL
jgi:iron complex outermembrane receptor protein